MVEKPYVISPEEFGDFDEYTKLSLTYYSDGVLADENDEIVDDIDETVGADFPAIHLWDILNTTIPAWIRPVTACVSFALKPL